MFDDPRRLSTAQTFKGWFFIAVTALLLFLLVRRVLFRLGASEAVARANEAKYRELFLANPHPMWVYDLETLRFLAVNDAAVAHYGYSRDEFLSLTIRDIRPPADIPRLLANVAAVTEGIDTAGIWRHSHEERGTDRGRRHLPYPALRRIVAPRWCWRRMSPHSGRPSVRRRKARNGCGWRWSRQIRDCTTSTSSQAKPLPAPSTPTCSATTRSNSARPMPNGSNACIRTIASRVAAAYRSYVAGEIPEYRVTFRQRTLSGGWKWILSVGSVVERDAQGNPLRMIGTHTDITEQKCAEQRIRRLSALYAALSDTNQAISAGVRPRCPVPDDLPRPRRAWGHAAGVDRPALRRWHAGGIGRSARPRHSLCRGPR
ncbi:MAG: PAS domain-containing protein [Comamonadaceae bacterium]|nr:PAS domain-containing protein [Comamonadaceae bacterium]